jgi:hypothetical protein
MPNNRIEYPKKVSPKGIAVYPHLNKPDDKFGDPTFKVTLRVPEEDAQDFISEVQAVLDRIKAGKDDLLRPDDAKRLAQGLKQKKLKAAEPAFVQETDDDGTPTGAVLLKFKAAGQYKDKDGNIKQRTIRFIDAAKQPITKAPEVWGGSTLRVRAQLMPWVNGQFSYGVKLGIDLVQIIELRSSGSGSSVNTAGFDDEDGYTATASSDAGSNKEASAGVSDGSEEDGDF